jgi:hypothetical protein
VAPVSNSDLYLQEARNTVRKALGKFDWCDHGMDNLDPKVNPDMSDEWKGDLAAAIVTALDKKHQLMYPKPDD